MNHRFWPALAVAVLAVSCARHSRTGRLMTWSEETQFAGMPLRSGEKMIVLRFVDDPGQGLFEDWSPALRDRLTRLGNPVRVTFDCWKQFGGTFGYNIVAIGGEPYLPAHRDGPSRAGAFSEGPARPNPLESAIQE